ncbi:MAG: conjugal transfer protein TraF [Firmicutes bacterium]|nr:conjugal transfer protein TraF [Bacillota bacterium]
MARFLRYCLIAFALLFTLWCTAAPAWGFTYENPAEAAFTKTHFELVFPQISLQGHNNLFSLRDLDLVPDNPDLEKELLARLEDKNFEAELNAKLRTGLTIGRFSLHFTPFTIGSAQMDYGIPKLLLLKTEGDSANHDLGGSKLQVLTGASLDFTYGHPITLTSNSQLGVGVTLRYVQGYGLVKAEVDKGIISFNKEENQLDVDVSYRYLGIDDFDNNFQTLFQNPSGTGLLVDLGVAYNYDRLRAGLVLKNMGVIKWRNLRQGSYSWVEAINEDEFDIDFKEDHTETRLSEYSMSLPLVLQAQGSYRLWGNLYWHLGMEKGFTDDWGISSQPCYQTGFEWSPRFLRLAGNISYQDGNLGYDGLFELRLFFIWLHLHLSWEDDGNGVYGLVMTALHF